MQLDELNGKYQHLLHASWTTWPIRAPVWDSNRINRIAAEMIPCRVGARFFPARAHRRGGRVACLRTPPPPGAKPIGRSRSSCPGATPAGRPASCSSGGDARGRPSGQEPRRPRCSPRARTPGTSPSRSTARSAGRPELLRSASGRRTARSLPQRVASLSLVDPRPARRRVSFACRLASSKRRQLATAGRSWAKRATATRKTRAPKTSAPAAIANEVVNKRSTSLAWRSSSGDQRRPGDLAQTPRRCEQADRSSDLCGPQASRLLHREVGDRGERQAEEQAADREARGVGTATPSRSPIACTM